MNALVQLGPGWTIVFVVLILVAGAVIGGNRKPPS